MTDKEKKPRKRKPKAKATPAPEVRVQSIGQLVHIPITRIKPWELNPRHGGQFSQLRMKAVALESDESTRRFDELVSSIRQKGVLQPILVRPCSDDPEVDFLIVAGERRWKAASIVAGDASGDDVPTIPAYVKDFTEDEAYDACLIENFHREDLTPIEEAESLARYVERFGMDKIPELAQRVNMSAQYVRRRVEVMRLPKNILKHWAMDYLGFAHLEQLTRIQGGKKAVLMIYKQILADMLAGDLPSSRQLGDLIERDCFLMAAALFDRTACAGCTSNTSVQLFLWKAQDPGKCLNPKCWKEKQRAELIDTWTETEIAKMYGTRSFRFVGEVQWSNCRDVTHSIIPRACTGCVNFITLLEPSMVVRTAKVCIGERSCYDEQRKAERQDQERQYTRDQVDAAEQPFPRVSADATPGNTTQPDNGISAEIAEAPAPAPIKARVEWHAGYFREVFFARALAPRIDDINQAEDDDKKLPRLMLMALIAGYRDIHNFVCYILNIRPTLYGGLSSTRIVEVILGLDDERVEYLLKTCTARAFLTDTFNESNRRMVAEYVGIALEREWKLTDEYLQKKNKAEIVRIIEEVGLERNVDFLRYIVSRTKGSTSYQQFINDPKTAKKDLVLAIKASGVDRKGLVPDEIKSYDNMGKFWPSQDLQPFANALFKGWTGPENPDPEDPQETRDPFAWREKMAMQAAQALPDDEDPAPDGPELVLDPDFDQTEPEEWNEPGYTQDPEEEIELDSAA
jgi:PRTRC genetic system ParB family protein